jgi:hypothetical protein
VAGDGSKGPVGGVAVKMFITCEPAEAITCLITVKLMLLPPGYVGTNTFSTSKRKVIFDWQT